MPIQLNGSTSGSVQVDVPAAVSGGDVSLTLPNGVGSANQFLKNSGTAGTLNYSSMVEDASGRLLINTSSSIPSPGIFNPALQVVHVSASADTCGISLSKFQAGNPSASPFIFQKSRNDTIGSHTIVADDDVLGVIQFTGSDGSTFVPAAAIEGEVDGTPGSTDMPGRLALSTTADGASTPTERMRIDSSGRLLIGATSAVSGADANGKLQVSQDVGSNTCILAVENTASSGNLSCIRARLRNHNPNSIFSAFLQCDDTDGSKFTLRSNGGLVNYSANNANLSDRNAKKDISAASGTWDRVKAWEIVNYRYKDQPNDADLSLGVIAQQVNESCPEVVTIFQEAKEATETEDAKEERLGVKEQQMQWMAIKALQEAIAKIETLETQNTAQQTQIDDLLARVTALEAA